MKRNLLNEIFKKYPNLGDINRLFELSTSELNQIVLTNSLEEAKEVLNKIINKEENDNNITKEKSKSLSLTPVYYMDC